MSRQVRNSIQVILALLLVVNPVLADTVQYFRGHQKIFKVVELPIESTAMDYINMVTQQSQAMVDLPDDCPDLDGDEFVDLGDFNILSENWLSTDPNAPGDFDDSNDIVLADLMHMTEYWLQDPQCATHYSDNLPYQTSFETFQGYTANENLDFQMGWNVLSGDAFVVWSVWHDTYIYHVAYMFENNEIKKGFNDNATDHRYVRCHVVPSKDAEILIESEGSTVAGLKFGTDNYIYVWHNGSFVKTNTNYYNYWLYMVWADIKFDINWNQGTYNVYWEDGPGSIYTANFDADYDVLTDISFSTDDDWMVVNRLSVSDYSSGDLDIEITSPCACNDDLDLKGKVPVKGQAWGEEFGLYELYLCPADLDMMDIDNWYRFDVGNQVSDPNGFLGYLNTSGMPNGLYHIGSVIYNDLGLSTNGLQVIYKEVWSGGSKIYDGPAYFPVVGDQKCNTFFHKEEPDISVPWPGDFPFELRRIYNNNRRFYSKPMANGWTHNNHITLTEDSRYYFEEFQNGLFVGPAWDEDMVGFGYIFVTYPDGSRKLYRHTDGTYGDGYWGPTKYYPYPDDGSGDYIVRTVTVDELEMELQRMRYTLHTQEGHELKFDSGNLSIFYYAFSSWGNLFGEVRSPIDSLTDRYGNTLDYTWNNDKTAVTEVNYGSGDTARRIKLYDQNTDGYYDEARLIVGNNDWNYYRKVQYDWDPNGIFTVQYCNDRVDEDGNYITDPNIAWTHDKYIYDNDLNLVQVAYGGNLSEPTIEIDYDTYGRVGKRREFVEADKYLETSYSYSFYNGDPNEELVPATGGEAGEFLKTIETTPFVTTTTWRNINGAVIEQSQNTADDSAVRDIFCKYEDSLNPQRPTEVKEVSDCFNKFTLNTYDSRGNLRIQKIKEEEEGDPYVTQYSWHTEYLLPMTQQSWQGINQTGALVESRYVYGRANGTIDPSPVNNKYRVQEKVFLAEDPCHPGDPNSGTWGITSYKYLTNGQPIEKIDPRGFRTVYEYDMDYYYPKWVKMGPSGSEEKVGRLYHDEIGQKLLEANSLGGVTLYDYDGFGRLYRVRTYDDPAALTIGDSLFIPSRYESMTELSDTRYGYDVRGNRTYVKKPDAWQSIGGIERTSYNLANQPAEIEYYTYNSGITDYEQTAGIEYDYNSRKLKELEVKTDLVTGKDWQTSFDYDSLGRIIETEHLDYDELYTEKKVVTDYYGTNYKKFEQLYGLEGLETQVKYLYNIFDQVIQRCVDPCGLALTTTYFYDAAGNRERIIDPSGNVLWFGHDNANRLVADYFAAEAGTAKQDATVKRAVEYYDDGKKKEIISFDYDGSTVLARVQLDYDNRGRVNEVIEDIDDTNQALTEFSYSDTGFGPGTEYHIRINDAENKDTWHRIDVFERLEKILYPSGNYQEMELNGDGTVKKRAAWDPCDVKYWIEYTYNGFQRIKQVLYPDAGYIDYFYDGFGRKREITDNRIGEITGTTSAYTHDPLNRIISVNDQYNYTIGYIYRGDGQKKEITVHNPTNDKIYHISYDYDPAGRLDSITEPDKMINGFVAELGYDDNGNRDWLKYYLTGSAFGSTVQINYDYNRDNLLTGFNTTSGPTFSLSNVTVDGLGRLTDAVETLSQVGGGSISHTLSFDYDRRSQLTDASISNIDGTTWTADYNYLRDGNLDDMTEDSQYSDRSYTGDLLTGSTGAENFTLDWDLNGNLISGLSSNINWNWDNKLRSAQSGTDSIICKYAPDGSLISKSTTQGTTVNRKFIVDITRDYPVLLMEINADTSQIAKTYIPTNGQILMQYDGDTSANRYLYLHDRIGSVRLLINSSGNAVNSYTYEPFGEAFHSETTENIENPFRFASYMFDSVTGMYFCNARWYHPVIARFTGQDPITGNFSEPLTLHAYLYCINDSINNTDNTGELGVAVGVAIAVGIVGTISLATWAAYSIVRLIEMHSLITTLVVEVTALGDMRITRNLRRNMIRHTGDPGPGYQAHHIFPQRFEEYFNNILSEIGLDIHHPLLGVWVDETHQIWSYEYNLAWENFIINNPNASLSQILQYAIELSVQFGFIFKPFL